jgi:N-ethylmaleimide reductase
MFTAQGMKPLPEPRALSIDEVRATVEDFRRAAAAAIAAGADGVEIHGANGYLVHQFLSSNANRRDDAYGRSIANRIRFAVEVASAIAEEVGADRTGIQISPGNPFNDIVEDDTEALYTALVDALAPLGLAYLNIAHQGDEELLATLRERWSGALILNRADASVERRARDVAEGLADVVTLGRVTLANPDIVQRVRTGAPLNEPDPATFYGGDERGYTDYPTLDGVHA